MEKILKLSQKKLFNFLDREFKTKKIKSKGNYLFIAGDAPCMLIAHLDTVHNETPRMICYSNDKNIIMSPQGIGGDDRCGVYALIEVYKRAKVKPCLLFTCDEETGGHGARKFADDVFHKTLVFSGIKFLIEIDRKGANDAVYYDCDNEEFEKYITSKGFKTAHGSFSDISVIAPDMGVAAVNLSSGYYNAHTQHEYINKKHLENTISRVVDIVNESENLPVFEYVDAWAWYDEYYNLKLNDKNPQYYFDEDYMKKDLYNIYEKNFLDEYIAAHGEGVIEELWTEEFGGRCYA